MSVYFAVKWCLGDTVAVHAEQKEVAQIAVDLAPGDPKAHYAVAVLNEKSFLPADLPKSLEEYETATSLSPNDFRLWFQLGQARDHNGNPVGAEKAYRQALSLAPNYARLQWALGNLLLRQGQTEEAFVEIRQAVENDPTFANPAVTLVWQFFNGDVSLISQKIGNSSPIKAALLSFLAGQKRFDEAFSFWNTLSPEEKKVTYKRDSDTLLLSLLAAQKFRAAFSVQTQINQPESGNEKFEPEKIYNAGFEADVKTVNPNIFEWLIADGTAPQIGYDVNQKHGGARSLVVVFNSNNGQDFRDIQQTVEVESGKHYRLELFARSELKTSAIFRWEVVDVVAGKVLVSTQAVPNNSDWLPLTADFTTNSNTQAITVRLARATCPASMCPVMGRIWFDDFNLKKIE